MKINKNPKFRGEMNNLTEDKKLYELNLAIVYWMELGGAIKEKWSDHNEKLTHGVLW